MSFDAVRPPRRADGFRRLSFLALPLTACVALLVLWGGLFAFIHHNRAQVEEGAFREAENYSIAFEEYVFNIVQNVDGALRHLGRLSVDAAAAGRPLPGLPVEDFAAARVFRLTVIGPDGMVRADSQAPGAPAVDVSEHDYFAIPAAAADDTLFISRPIQEPATGRAVIQFSRRLVLPDGTFAGVLALAVDQREFEDFFHRIDVGRRGLVALFGLDGWMRARGAQIPEMLRASSAEPLPMTRPYFESDSARQGRVSTAGYYDGIDRLGAYRRVRAVPLVVSVQFARDEVFASHAQRTVRTMVVGAVLTLAIVLGLTSAHVFRRQRDAALTEAEASERRWRLAVDAVGDGVWDWTPQTGAIFFSRQMGEIVGMAVDRLPATIPAWFASIHPADRPGLEADFDAFLSGRSSHFYHEYRARCGDGSYKWVLDRAVVVSRDAGRRPLRVIGLRSDISHRRRLEEELRNKGEEMQELQAALVAREIGVARHRLSEAQKVARLGIIERDPASGRWMACGHAQALLGLLPAASYSDDQVLVNMAEASRALARDLLAAADLSTVNQEIAVESGGELRFLRAVGCAPATEEENAFITLQDISARRASEQEHMRLRERMEEASRLESLGTLAGGIAHEINTPAQYVGDNLGFLDDCVPALIALAEAARRRCAAAACTELQAELAATDLDFLAKEVPEAIAQGLEGVRRIAKIVQAVKEFCYPSSRDPQPCALSHMIESAVTVTRNAWKYSSEMVLELDPALPQVHAIEGEINQVLINLIINAAQSIEEKKAGPGRITIRTWHGDDAVMFSVADSGVGIPADRHKRIFELFYTTKPPGQGTGQGLAISSAIIRRHGGTIAVASQPGAGACFTVTLPLRAPTQPGGPL